MAQEKQAPAKKKIELKARKLEKVETTGWRVIGAGG